MVFSRRFLAYLSTILFAVIIGFSFMFVKVAIRFADPLDVLAARFTVAFLFSLIILLAARTTLSIQWREVMRLLPLALLNPFLYFITQALGLVSLPASEAGIIQATIPIFTMILAASVLSEKTTWMQKGSAGLSVFGVILIFLMSGVQIGFVKWGGIALLLASTLSYAGYNVLARTTAQKYNMFNMSLIMIMIGFVSFHMAAVGKHLIQGTLFQYFEPFAHPLFLLSVLFLGVFASTITFFLSNFALSEIEASKFGVFTNLTTIISIFSGAFFLNEGLYAYHYIGALLVIIGVIGVNTFSAGRDKEKLQ